MFPVITNPRMEPLPDFAYLWRPYASPDLICKRVQTPAGPALFLVDPWTQHWLVADTTVHALLKLANGKRRLTEIVRTLHADPDVTPPQAGFVGLARELQEIGMLFQSQAEHRASGTEVYNTCDPIGMHLEITNACNMTCTHCYVASGKRLPSELTLDEIKKTIDMLPPFSGKRIALSGGEPAVRKDCGDIIEYCVVECGHAVDLYTNGKKFPRRLAERIRAINERGGAQVRIQVSLEGASPRTNDLVRGDGSFEATLESLRLLQEMDLIRTVILFVCLTKYNIGEVDNLIRLAEDLDVAMLVFSQWQRQGNASDVPWASIAPTFDGWVAIGERLLQYQNPRLQVFGNFFGDLNNNPYGRFCLDGPLFPKHVYFYNAFPRVAPDGQVFADQLWVDPDWVLGNVREKTLDQCFQSPKFYQQVEEMRGRTNGILECQVCEWRRLCEGGSPGHTYAEYGHMYQKDLFCASRIYWFNRYVEYQIQKVCPG